MIDVHRANRQAALGVRSIAAAPCGQLRHRGQQARGIGTAAHSHNQSRRGRGHVLVQHGLQQRRAEAHRSSTVAEYTESAQAGLAGIQQLRYRLITKFCQMFDHALL